LSTPGVQLVVMHLPVVKPLTSSQWCTADCVSASFVEATSSGAPHPIIRNPNATIIVAIFISPPPTLL
jgi:hypothetical protein